MKRFGLVALTFLCSSFAFGQYTETHYVCPNGDGAGATNGTSWGNCFDGFADVAWDVDDDDDDAVGQNDKLELRDDDGPYRETLTIGASGTSGKVIFVGAESGDTPIISGADIISPWGDEGGDVWSAALGAEPDLVFLNGTLGISEGGACPGALNVDTEWCWDTNVLYQHSTSDPDIRYTSPGTEASQRNSAIVGTSKDYITIDGLTVRQWQDSGIDNSGGDTWVVQNNTVSGGSVGTAARGIDMRGAHGSNISTITIRENTIGTIGESNNSSPLNYVGIRVFYVNDSIIENNTVATTYSTGIFSRGEVNSYNVNSTIQYNDISNYYGLGIGQTRTSGTKTVRYNLIHDGSGAGYVMNWCGGLEDTTDISYNKIHDITGIAGYYNGIDINQDCDGGQIANNTIYGVGHGCLAIEVDCDGWTAKNNILDASQNNEPNVGFGQYCLYTVDADNDNGYDYNQLYPMQAGPWDGFVARIDVAPCIGCERTLAAWRTQLGVTWGETDAAANSNEGDPLVRDAAGGDFTLTGASPAINAGTDVGLTVDFAGRAVPNGHSPDIGAYESDQQVMIIALMWRLQEMRRSRLRRTPK